MHEKVDHQFTQKLEDKQISNKINYLLHHSSPSFRKNIRNFFRVDFFLFFRLFKFTPEIYIFF